MQEEHKLVTIIRWVILGGLVIVPFLPLEITWFLPFPLVTGRNFTFRILIELLMGLWVVLISADRRFLPRRSPILLAYCIFVLIVALADILGANPALSFWSNFERMDGLINLIHLLAYLFLLLAMLRKIDWRRYLLVFFLAALCQMFIGSLQVFGASQLLQGNRIDGNLGNSTYFAAYLMFTICLAVLVASQNRPKWLKVSLIILSVAAFALDIPTGTRGSILALVIGALALGVLLLIGGSKKQRLVLAVVLGSFAVLVAVYDLVKDIPAIHNHPAFGRFANISLENLIHENRLQLWAMAGQGFLERPILGWGQENFHLVFDKFYDPSLYGQEAWFDRAHNIIMDWLVAGGFLGLLAFLSLFGVAFWLLWRKRSRGGLTFTQRGIVSATIVAYFVQNLFLFDNLASYIGFVALLAFIQSQNRDKASIPRPPVPPAPLALPALRIISVSLVTALLVTGLIYAANLRPLQAGSDLIAAENVQNPSPDNLQRCFGLYQSALSVGGLGNQEIRERVLQTSLMLNQSDRVSPENKQRFLALAISEFEKQVLETPLSAKHRWMLGNAHLAAGNGSEAIASFKESLRLSPQRQMYMNNLAFAYVGLKDYQNALAVAKQAYDLMPQSTELRERYALMAVYAGKDDIAKGLLGPNPLYDDNFIKAYATIGKTDKVVAIWQNRTALNPGDPQAHFALSAAYLLNNQRQKAIDELQTAKRLAPQAKDMIEYYINEIKAGRNPQ